MNTKKKKILHLLHIFTGYLLHATACIDIRSKGEIKKKRKIKNEIK